MNFRNLLKSAFVAGIISCTSYSAFAQGAYAKLGGGYNFGSGSTIKYRPTTNSTQGSGGSDWDGFEWGNVKYGQGAVFGGAAGYMFNPHFGFEVSVNYLQGIKNEVKIEPNNSQNFGNISFPLNIVAAFSSTTEIYSTQSQMVLVQPSLIVAAGLPKFNPYTRIGIIVAKGNLKNAYSYSNSSGESLETEETYLGGLGFGFQVAAGLNFNLNDKFTIYLEGAYNNLTYAPERGEVTKYNHNGNDYLASFKTSQRETNFEADYTSSYNPQDPDSPRTAPSQRFILHSVGLNLGLKYNF